MENAEPRVELPKVHIAGLPRVAGPTWLGLHVTQAGTRTDSQCRHTWLHTFSSAPTRTWSGRGEGLPASGATERHTK
jgi:hypothetical protein